MLLNKPFKYYFVSILISFFLIESIPNNWLNKRIENFESSYLPSDFELLKRVFPYNNYDKRAYPDAVKKVKDMRKLKKITKSVQNQKATEWQFVGPTNISGRIVDIEFNPLNPDIVYAAAATGGVFKSINKGLTWYPIFDDQPILTIGDIAIDPLDPDIIYVGTGEANGGHNNFPGIGIYKSNDAGNSWKHIGLDSTVSIGRIIIDPENTNRIFVAAVGSYFSPNRERGVYLSENKGESWTKSLFVSDSTGAIDLVINPNNSKIIYAAMWERVRRPVYRSETHLYGPSGGIFKSIDGGINWDKLGPDNGLPNPLDQNIGRIGLAISESNPSILYATYNDGNILTGLYKTVNSGLNWTLINDQFDGSGTFSWYFGQVRVDPINPENVYVLDVSFLKSTNSGQDLQIRGNSNLHVDHHALAFDPTNSNYIISGNDGGINISQDAGETWLPPAELPITQFYEIGLDFNNPNRFYGGTQDNRVVRTITGNKNDWDKIFGGDGFYVIVNPEDPNIIYAESQFGGLGKSTDGGENFVFVLEGIDPDEPTNWSTPVVMDPNNSNILYYGTHSLYRTENGASFWKKISPKLTDYIEGKRLGTISTIAIAENNSEVLLVGTDDGHVWVSSDYGELWKDISSSLPFRWVTRVAIDPLDENIFYVTYSGLRWNDPEPRVFKSLDMGESWIEISNGLPDAPVNAFAINPNNTDILYLGNDVGAFISTDKGNSWDIIDENLPIVVVNDMKIHPIANYLAIGTHGRGIYKLSLEEVVKNEDFEPKLPTAPTLYQNYPNPFNPATQIDYVIPESVNLSPLKVKLRILDNLGKQVSVLVDESQQAGNYSIAFDAVNLSSGVYYYQLETAAFSIVKKMIYIK